MLWENSGMVWECLCRVLGSPIYEDARLTALRAILLWVILAIRTIILSFWVYAKPAHYELEVVALFQRSIPKQNMFNNDVNEMSRLPCEEKPILRRETYGTHNQKPSV